MESLNTIMVGVYLTIVIGATIVVVMDAVLTKRISEKESEKEFDGSFFEVYVFPAMMILTPIINIFTFVIMTKWMWETWGQFKEKRKKEKVEMENPHWEDFKNFKIVCDEWYGLIDLKDQVAIYQNVKNIISKNLKNKVIVHLLEENSTMFLEMLEVKKEAVKMEPGKKRKVMEEWLEVLMLFAEEVISFDILEQTIENEMQNKKMEQLLEGARRSKRRMKKTNIEGLYREAVGK